MDFWTTKAVISCDLFELCKRFYKNEIIAKPE